MPAFVALLRGVNVGKARRVPMVALRDMLTRLGYTGVATALNSGNAVFHAAKGTSARHASDIAAAISDNLHIEVLVIVKSATEMSTIVSENPLLTDAPNPSRLLVAFVQDSKALSGLAAIESFVVPPERFAIGRKAAYLLCPDGIRGSNAGAALLGKTGRAATTRNWSTVLRLQALSSEDDA
jgi:uncharacterized protein (DUF1697 family)